MNVKLYLNDDEITPDELIKCHQIVKTIIEFGINEKQKLKLLYLLALELENREYLQEISFIIKKCETNECKKSTLIKDF
jgi:hypothetical protein